MNNRILHSDDMVFGLYLCRRGECDMTINGAQFHIHEGATLIKSPLLRISDVRYSNDCQVMTIFEEDIVDIAPIASKNFDTIQDLLNHDIFDIQLSESDQLFLLERMSLIDRYKGELQSELSFGNEHQMLREIIIMIEQTTILEYARMLLKRGDTATIRNGEGGIMVRFMFLLFQHYKEHREVAYYANALHFSTRHFTRIIKQTSHRTPSEWIAMITIYQAKRLLHKTNNSVKEVAEALNFPEQFTFRKYFKHHTGCSPKEYKQGNL